MWELDHEEWWALKNWCFQIVVLEKTPERPLHSKIEAVNPRGNQPWIFIRKTDAKAKTPILWPPDVKSWLTEKDPDAGKGWGQKEKGATGDEMVGWHHWLNGHEFEQTLEVSEAQGSLVCCSPWTHKELDTWLSNWSEVREVSGELEFGSCKNKLNWPRILESFQRLWVYYLSQFYF